MGNSRKDSIEIRLGSCPNVNALLREEVELINPEYANVEVVEHKREVLPNGMTPIAGTQVLYNGEVVANGCKEAAIWLKGYHTVRVKLRQASFGQLAVSTN